MINVVDTETTSFEGQVVEIACVVVGDTIEFSEDGFMQSLVKPTCLIEPEAMGTHHITDEMVASAPSLNEVFTSFGLDVHDVWAAHNAEFDRKALGEAAPKAARWICTWRCAMHLWPDAPSHKNQALRYWLKLDVGDMPPEAGASSHRALYDAWVTAKLLRREMLEIQAAVMCHDGPDCSDAQAMEELIKLSTKPLVLKKVKFGKHRDELWKDVPRDYLRWVLRQDFDSDTHHTCRHYLGMLV